MKHLLFLLLFAATVAAKAQTNTYTYSYDAAGNRTSRVLKLSQNTREAKDQILTDEIASQELSIFPNPSKGLVNIAFKDESKITSAEVLVYNVQGRLVLQQKGITDFKTVNLSDQEVGVYMLHLIVNGEKVVWKVMKE